jgi:hypothetical protein
MSNCSGHADHCVLLVPVGGRGVVVGVQSAHVGARYRMGPNTTVTVRVAGPAQRVHVVPGRASSQQGGSQRGHVMPL